MNLKREIDDLREKLQLLKSETYNNSNSLDDEISLVNFHSNIHLKSDQMTPRALKRSIAFDEEEE